MLPDMVIVSVFVVVLASQCTYRCVVLPDGISAGIIVVSCIVSMHLQVRGAP